MLTTDVFLFLNVHNKINKHLTILKFVDIY